MTSTYSITVDAPHGQRDAEDIAKRRAREDGFRVLLVLRSHRVGLPVSQRWSVELVVERREEQA